MTSLVIVKVVEVLKLRIKIAIHKPTIDKPNHSSTINNTVNNTVNNITMAINDIPPETNCLYNAPNKLQTVSPIIDNICDKIDNKDNKDNIQYDRQFVSFIIMYPFHFNSKYPSTGKKLIGSNILSTKNIIPSYEIEYTKDFKYKKFIREKMLTEFKYKNKDISIIKSINVYKNYHNYVVVMNKCSVRHKQYSNNIHIRSTIISWHQVYDYVDVSKLEAVSGDVLCRELYEYLTTYSKLDYFYTDPLKENYINMKNIYSILACTV